MTVQISSDEGEVGEIATGPLGPTITYRDAWRAARAAYPISLTMSLARATYGPDVVTPWLMNLLPEGQPLEAMTRALGVGRADVMGLLTQAGRDLAGALTIAQGEEHDRRYLAIRDTDALERIINELPVKPFLVGDEGVAMSLAGAQDKLPLAVDGAAFSIPINGAPSTHILKPDNPRLPGSVQNEALCMVLARRCGLSVPDIITGVAGARSYLLVRRYDRITSDGHTTRIHQEDFCQALGLPPASKYQHNGTGVAGPSIATMFALVREHMTARDINRLLDAVIFNIAIGNVDSHAKNYSILLSPRYVELAPFYDLMSGLSWNNITPNHAQDIGGKRTGRHIYARHWRRMAAEAGVSATATLRRVNDITASILAELSHARTDVADMPAGPGVMLDTFVADITARVRTVQRNARIAEGEEETEGGGAPSEQRVRYDGQRDPT